jgi:DNA-binding response OmpR family regulator
MPSAPPAALLLYVEDEVLMHLIVQDALQEAGFEVALARCGTDALELVRRNPEGIRGLITDIDLGKGIDGWEIARNTRELIPGLPVIYVSGASGHEWSSKGVPKSMMIAKPFATAQIVTAIATLLNEAAVG